MTMPKGVVTCFTMFVEHIMSAHVAFPLRLITARHRWNNMTESEQKRISDEAMQYPIGDSAIFMMNVHQSGIAYNVRDNEEEHFSHLIEMWMYMACELLFDLDEEKSPPSLVELAKLACDIGKGKIHNRGKENTVWTFADVEKVFELVKQVSIDLDKLLGVQEPQWAGEE